MKPNTNTKAPPFILCIKKLKPETKKKTAILATNGQGLGETK